MEVLTGERGGFKHWIRLSSDAFGVTCLFFFSLTLLLTGCMHKMPLSKRAFSLEGPPEFPIMTPSGTTGIRNNDFQENQLELAGKAAPTNALPRVNCIVKGNLFSFAPAKSFRPGLWVVTSPNVQAWERRADSIDLESEWMSFAREVLALQRSGCLPKDETSQDILRQISEAIPVPASEELLYTYSLGRSGFVDLIPGMQLVIERASFRTKAGTSVPASGTDAFSEYLKVVERGPSGSSLRVSETVSRGLGKALGNEGDSPRSVLDRFAASSSLRLMLLTLRNDDTRRFPVLLGATEPFEVWEASTRIAGGKLTECPSSSSSGLECLFLDKDWTVSVLMSVWVNGRRAYQPLGTTVGSLIGRLPESEMNRALATISMERPLVVGGYARVNFPHDLEGASKIILLNGDRLSWHH